MICSVCGKGRHQHDFTPDEMEGHRPTCNFCKADESPDGFGELTPREIIEALRGEPPAVCDWCGKQCPPEEMEPEEAGMWVCQDCFFSD